jgi:hypothetical protein
LKFRLSLSIRWPRAGGDLAQPNGIHQGADRASIRSEHPPKCLIYWPDVACGQTCRRRRDNITPIIEIGANIKSP